MMGEKVTVQNGYTFTTDTGTGTVTARGELQAQMAPRSHLDADKAGLLMTEGTQKGHLVPARDNGPTTAENISAQHKDLNQSTVKKVENAENRLMADKENPARIQTERIAFAKNQRRDGKIQPDAYLFKDQINYADGTKDKVNLSFTNISKEQQEGLNAELEAMPVPEMPNPGDILRERMDPKEYARLMEATDRELPDLRTEFEKADTKKGKNEVQNMADRESFLKSLEVSPEVKAQLAQVSKDHAAKDQSKGKKTSTDDGGRERSDSRDGRESGYKSGSKDGTKDGAKNGAKDGAKDGTKASADKSGTKDGTKASSDQGGNHGTVQGARAAAVQGAKSSGTKGGKSGAVQGARAAAGGEKGGRGAAVSGGSRGSKAGAAAAAASGGRGGSSGGRGGSSGGHGGTSGGGGHGGSASGGGHGGGHGGR